jgi:DNA-binding winged helix-turn-helix (wHTH) protein
VKRGSAPPICEFGPFRIDTVRRILLRDGQAVPLTPKAFEILVALLRRKGDVVTKDELIATVWPDTTVEENNLTRNISSLRKALGEGAGEHRYVVTIPGRGYSFVAEVKELGSGVAEDLPSARRVRKVLAAVIAVLAVATLLYLRFRMGPAAPFQKIAMTRLTTANIGNSPSAAISPDGKYLV